MYTIELTEKPGWDAPTLQARLIKTTVDPAKVAILAAAWLHEVQQNVSDAESPDGWRVVDGIGRRVKTRKPKTAPRVGWRQSQSYPPARQQSRCRAKDPSKWQETQNTKIRVSGSSPRKTGKLKPSKQLVCAPFGWQRKLPIEMLRTRAPPRRSRARGVRRVSSTAQRPYHETDNGSPVARSL